MWSTPLNNVFSRSCEDVVPACTCLVPCSLAVTESRALRDTVGQSRDFHTRAARPRLPFTARLAPFKGVVKSERKLIFEAIGRLH